ncbi:MAG TPA: hypothetical protein VIK04_10310 [Solirubrobacteraceae bacterium]
MTLVAVVCAGIPSIAQARWGRPFQFAAPGTLDVLAPAVAFSPGGAAAAAFGIEDVDTPGTAQADLTLRSPTGGVGSARPVSGAAQILALAYDGGSLELLTGTSPAKSDLTCCSSAQAVQIGAGGVAARPRTLVGGLAGATLGRLVTLADGQMLAAVATERGVWVVQSPKANRFGAQHLLTGGGKLPETLAAAGLGGETSIVAWSAATGIAGAADPRTISYAKGSRASAPHGVRSAVTVPAGRRVDEVGVAPRAGGATVAWVESWYDHAGGYHSQVEATDIGPHAVARTLSPANRLASGLTFAGDVSGDQALTWESCTAADSCQAQVAVRRASGQFGAVRTVGAVDQDQPPALAVGAHGQTLVGWIESGQPFATAQPKPGRGWRAATKLSASTYASDVTVGVGPHGQGLAAWTQGTLNPSVVGAVTGSL